MGRVRNAPNNSVDFRRCRWLIPLVLLLLAILLASRFYNHSVTSQREWPITCATKDYQNKIPGCTPSSCKRVIIDQFITNEEVDQIKRFIDTAMKFGGGSGGPTIFELTTGALSYEANFIDLYAHLQNFEQKPHDLFRKSDLKTLAEVLNRVKSTVLQTFHLKKLYLTTPLFFSKISGELEAQTPHDEYWHPHVDKKQYGTFVFTSLLYLSDFGTDFEGGAFVFIDKKSNQTIQPSRGRLSFFTSGSENVHHVQRVTKGLRYALTIAFACESTDVEASIEKRLAFLSTLS